MTNENRYPHIEGTITITVLYDNRPFDERLQTKWGFSALIEYDDRRVLFDTGGDSPTLLANMDLMGIDPTGIETLLLSHAHGDHTGGLEGLLEKGISPTVYLPLSFSTSYKRELRQQCPVEEVTPGQKIAPGAFTTGEMEKDIPCLGGRESQSSVILARKEDGDFIGLDHQRSFRSING